MPYNRAKGRTHEIPPTPSPGTSRPGRSNSALSNRQLLDPRQLDERISGIQQQQQQRVESPRPWVQWPLAVLTTVVYKPVAVVANGLLILCERTPAVVPAVLAMIFLYIGMPLLIAGGFI